MPTTRRTIAESLHVAHAAAQELSLQDRLVHGDATVKQLAVNEVNARRRNVIQRVVQFMTLPQATYWSREVDEDIFEYHFRSPHMPIGTVTTGGDTASIYFDIESDARTRKSALGVVMKSRRTPVLPVIASISDITMSLAYGGGVDNRGQQPIEPLQVHSFDVRRGISPILLDQIVRFEEGFAMIDHRADTDARVAAFY
jgi:hypothetical protein